MKVFVVTMPRSEPLVFDNIKAAKLYVEKTMPQLTGHRVEEWEPCPNGHWYARIDDGTEVIVYGLTVLDSKPEPKRYRAWTSDEMLEHRHCWFKEKSNGAVWIPAGMLFGIEKNHEVIETSRIYRFRLVKSKTPGFLDVSAQTLFESFVWCWVETNVESWSICGKEI